uniref:G domain-containing protein n=1 Tax=Mycena chlorophos TaxID=658473 RepID=A0ABQ0L7G6_MYCCL|nr:predicted protein [Mycena chlorophos]
MSRDLTALSVYPPNSEASPPFPLFHVLVAGSDRSGKTRLINHVLGPGLHNEANLEWDALPGLTSLRNPRFALHELAYVRIPEDGLETRGIAKLERLREANKMQQLSEQFHAIWFCVRVPFDNLHNALTSSELDFLRNSPTTGSKPPSFGFDKLVARLEEELSLPDNSSDDAAEQLTLQRAFVKFEESCLQDLLTVSPPIPYLRTSGSSHD